jgi:hypothetical protein
MLSFVLYRLSLTLTKLDTNKTGMSGLCEMQEKKALGVEHSPPPRTPLEAWLFGKAAEAVKHGSREGLFERSDEDDVTSCFLGRLPTRKFMPQSMTYGISTKQETPRTASYM